MEERGEKDFFLEGCSLIVIHLDACRLSKM